MSNHFLVAVLYSLSCTKNNSIKSATINDIVPQLVNFYKTLSESNNVKAIHSSTVNKLKYFNSLKDSKKGKNIFII